MLKTQEVATSGDFYEQVYNWAIASRLPSIQVFAGCTVTRDSGGRTSSLTLSFSTNSSTIEYRILESEDHEDTRGVKDKERSQAVISKQLETLSKYLSSDERPYPIKSKRISNYIVVQTYKNLEAVLSH